MERVGIYGVVHKIHHSVWYQWKFQNLIFLRLFWVSDTLLGWLQAWLQEILQFVSNKRSISSIINVLGDTKNKRQRTIAIFLQRCAKAFIADNLNYWSNFSWSPWTLQQKLRLTSCTICTALVKRQEHRWEGEFKKWLNPLCWKFPHRREFTFGQRPGMKNSQSKKNALAKAAYSLKRGLLVRAWGLWLVWHLLSHVLHFPFLMTLCSL